MARVREFNENIALDRAIELFWERGYAHTSMREVVKHTGVAHAGLYTAFGGKDDLFKAAIEKYEERIFTYLFGGLESTRASLKDIKKLFHFITSAKDDKYFQHGCFIANSALEFGNTEHPINEVLTRTFNRQVRAFANALNNALQLNQIKASTNVQESAASFAVLFYGCSSLTRMNAPSEAIQQAIAAALSSIEE